MKRPKCSRPNCTRVVQVRDLCKQHALVMPHGYKDAAEAGARIELLRSLGVSLPMIHKVSGIVPSVVLSATRGGKIRMDTHIKIMAIPVPDGLVASTRSIPSLGTHRRVRALSVLGHPQSHIAREVGVSQRSLSNVLVRDQVSTRMALAVAAAYDRISMTIGPDARSSNYAKRNGWAPPLAWNDIDDPNEQPDVGTDMHVSSMERVAELQQLGVHDVNQIARRLGTKPESVERLLLRHQKGEAA